MLPRGCHCVFQDVTVQSVMYVHRHKYTHMLGADKKPLYKCRNGCID